MRNACERLRVIDVYRFLSLEFSFGWNNRFIYINSEEILRVYRTSDIRLVYMLGIVGHYRYWVSKQKLNQYFLHIQTTTQTDRKIMLH